MKKYYLIFAYSFVSCTNIPETHHDLLLFESKFIMENDLESEPYFQNKKAFLKPFLKIINDEDTIFVTTVKGINTCTEFHGDISIKADTIQLITVPVGGEICTSESLYLCKYKILNSYKKNYRIFDDTLYIGNVYNK